MSPHNTRYKNKAAEVAKVGTASKSSPRNPSTQMQKAKANNSKSPPRSMSFSSSPSSSSPSTTSSSSSRSNSSSGAPSGEISKPKRPLSAYNFFFKHTRDEILASTSSSSTTAYDHSKHATTLQSASARRDLSKKGRPPPHHKIGFAEMARQIGTKWKALEGDRREHFESLAKTDKQRYLREMDIWKAAGGDKLLQNQKDKNTAGTASSAGTNPSSTKSTASKTSRKSPPSSPKSKKSRSKKSKIDTSKVARQPPQQEIYSHEDYLSYTIGAPSSSTQQPSTSAYDNLRGTLDRACEIAKGRRRFSGETQHVDCDLPHTVSGRSSMNSSTSTLYESAGTSAGANAGTASNNYSYESYGSYVYTSGQQQRPHMYHNDFQPPIATRRVSEGNDMGDSTNETLYPGHYTSQQRDYSGHNQGHYNRQHWSAPPPYYPYQQVVPSHGRNVSVSSARPDVRGSKVVSSNWNTTTRDCPAAGAPTERTGASLRSHHSWEPTTCKIPSSSTGNEADVKSSQEPKWSDFDDADRLLDVLGNIDEDDVKFWGAANPMA